MPERDWQKDWEMCQRATPGPWESRGTLDIRPAVWKGWRLATTAFSPAGDPQRRLDAEFIAEARSALPYWLQRVRELEAEWLAEAEEKVRLRYAKTQLEEENARLRARVEKLETVAEAAREVIQTAINQLRNSDGLLRLESWVLVPQELMQKLASALDAIEKVK